MNRGPPTTLIKEPGDLVRFVAHLDETKLTAVSDTSVRYPGVISLGRCLRQSGIIERVLVEHHNHTVPTTGTFRQIDESNGLVWRNVTQPERREHSVVSTSGFPREEIGDYVSQAFGTESRPCKVEGFGCGVHQRHCRSRFADQLSPDSRSCSKIDNIACEPERTDTGLQLLPLLEVGVRRLGFHACVVLRRSSIEVCGLFVEQTIVRMVRFGHHAKLHALEACSCDVEVIELRTCARGTTVRTEPSSPERGGTS